jgi:hypothetical protein
MWKKNVVLMLNSLCRYEHEMECSRYSDWLQAKRPWICSSSPRALCVDRIALLTFIKVLFETGTNFPAVSVNSLLAMAMMKARQRWNGTGVPTQSHPQAASLTLSAWRIVHHWDNFVYVSYIFVRMKYKIYSYLFGELVSKPADQI